MLGINSYLHLKTNLKISKCEDMVTLSCFLTIFAKRGWGRGATSMTSCLPSWRMKPFPNGATLKGKNLFLREQILSFKS